MSALSFIGKLDRREESLILSEEQERKFIKRLLGSRGNRVAYKLFGTKLVRDTYVPPRAVNGTSVVMPRN